MTKVKLFSVLTLVTVLSGCNLTVENSGGGTVSSSDERINCGETCTASYSNTNNELITLTAIPDAGYEFSGWGGKCAELEECVVSIGAASGDKLVTAQFSEVVTNGAGGVSRNFINRNYIIDMDGDGDLDIVNTSGVIQWIENDSGTFIPHSLPFTASLVFAGDMDNDSDIDIVAASGAVITLYKNDGSQNFTSHQVDDRNYSLIYDSHGMYLADMDNDGFLDIIAAWLGQDWYKNDKSGNFTKQSLAGRGKDIIAADVDLDGDMDFIESDNDIILHVNDGSQSFSKLVLLDDGGASSFPVDIDADGDIDIASVSRRKNEIYLFVNDGDNVFSMLTVASEKNSSHIFASDIDNDGKIDILNGTVWYKNNGQNVFSSQGSIVLDYPTLIDLAEK